MANNLLNLGIEIEQECQENGSYDSDNYYKYVQEIMENAGLNNYGEYHGDGSLNYGFEISSEVISSNEFLSNRKENPTFNWEKWFEVLNKNVVIKDSIKAGMHVHIDKKHISPCETLKLNYFIFRNREFCEMIGEREVTRYCSSYENPVNYCKVNRVNWNNDGSNCPIRNKKMIQPIKSFNYSHGWSGASDAMKYKMLNVARPHTIEFRFFKSPSNYNTFLKNMQFVIALHDFIRHSNLNISFFKGKSETLIDAENKEFKTENKTVQNLFCQFVTKNRKIYGNLHKFLNNKGLCAKVKENPNNNLYANSVINCNLRRIDF